MVDGTELTAYFSIYLPYLEWVGDGAFPLPGDGHDAVDGGGD